MNEHKQDLPTPARSGEVAAFLERVARAPVPVKGSCGRLIFAIDATASREPTWDRASHLQAEMFHVTEALGGLEVQLVYYRGYGELRASPWVSEAASLARQMTAVSCRGGLTQIERVLRHCAQEAATGKVSAVVFVGDCVEESPAKLYQVAGELSLRGAPAFMFLEGHDRHAEACFAEIAAITHGAFCRFDSGSAEQLRQLLTAVAVYASGGREALRQLAHGQGALLRQLAHQVDGG